MKICPNCGKKQSADKKFCTNCGHKFSKTQANIQQNNLSVNIQKAHKKTSKKKLGIGIGILVVLALIIGGISWYKSPAHNPNSPFANTNITFAKYNYGTAENSKIISRVSWSSTFKVTDNLFAIMFKNADGNSEAYKYFKSHPELRNGVTLAVMDNETFDNLIKKEDPSYYKTVLNTRKAWNTDKTWIKLGDKDKKLIKIIDDWGEWSKSNIPNNEDSTSEGLRKLLVVYEGQSNDLQNGQTGYVKVGGNLKLLIKYKVDLQSLKIKVNGITAKPIEIE